MYSAKSGQGDYDQLVVQWSAMKVWNITESDILGKDYTFEFQVVLKSNGDIWFNYLKVPFNPMSYTANVYEDGDIVGNMNYPLTIGLEDAVEVNEGQYRDYAPVLFDFKNITSGSSIIFKALPTCLDFVDCSSCALFSQTTQLNCGWCPNRNLCADREGRESASMSSGCIQENLEISSPINCTWIPSNETKKDKQNGEDKSESEDKLTSLVIALIVLSCIAIVLVVGGLCFWFKSSKLTVLRSQNGSDDAFQRMVEESGTPAAAAGSGDNSALGVDNEVGGNDGGSVPALEMGTGQES
jgi:hypothetical protein